MDAGSASRSRTCLTTPIGSRSPPTSRSRTASAPDGDGGPPTGPSSLRSTASGPAASRSKSRYCKRHLHATDSVGDRVVHLLHERRLATAQPLDDGELPQRAGAVERVDHGQRRQVEQLAQAPGLGQGDPANVVVDLEVRVVDPERRREVGRGRLHTPPEPWHGGDRPFHPRPEPVEVRRAIEHRDAPERRRQVGVLLEAPHQPLGVAHPPFVGVGHRSSIAHGAYRRCPLGITRTWTNC